MRTSCAVSAVKTLREWPRMWGIPARSAFVTASVLLIALVIAGAGLLAVLYTSLISGVDDVAGARVGDIVAGLHQQTPAHLDRRLLAVDQRIVAVQVIDSTGAILRASDDAPVVPIISTSQTSGSVRRGLPDAATGDGDVRVSTQTVDGIGGRYTVIVGAGSESVETSLITVAGLLAVGAPVIVAVSAVMTYLLVSRSLRSVDAIRARVAEISTSDLAERVPVPVHRGEISALATTMNEMLARIEAGHNEQRRFVGDASHELRSPLATIISALDVVVAHPETLDSALVEHTLLPEARRMQWLIEDLLLLAGSDERGLPLRHEEVDLDDIAAEAAARARTYTELTVRADISPTRMIGDVDAISRVLRNLVDNASRHARTTVEITVTHDDAAAYLTVSDDGPGIPVSDRIRVFDRFVRLDADRGRGSGGSGLGLAIVAEIVTAHRGRIEIADRDGGGTIVSVSLPRSLPTTA